MGEITTIGKLKHAHATFITCFDYIFTGVEVTIEKHRYHTGFLHSLHDLHLIKLCHYLNI